MLPTSQINVRLKIPRMLKPRHHHAHAPILAARIAFRRAPRKPPGKGIWALLGPGLITGASDDDPSGIATYSQSGAQFGYAMCWTMFLTTPFMIAIQLVSARVGAVTGQGLAR